ncbi:DUF397 domain-containing protein [Streptomyces sp. ID-01-6.2a]|uniref:DUF397 domain-containing protein n=1 Tax=Streptomyces caniscabiei TaxID=2746961 RepID=A0A927QK16_9ACTN|nr:DUF397 domain-containing protein [Streptomyces caniscabiei]
MAGLYETRGSSDYDPEHVLVRDTKVRGRGMLAVQRGSWAALRKHP